MSRWPSSKCRLAAEPWHDDRADTRYTVVCCDHAPLGAAERKRLRQQLAFGPAERKSGRVLLTDFRRQAYVQALLSRMVPG